MKDLEKKVAMAGAGKIMKFFERVDEPLPIHWTHSNSNFAHERVPDTLVHVVPSNVAFLLEAISHLRRQKPSPPSCLRLNE